MNSAAISGKEAVPDGKETFMPTIQHGGASLYFEESGRGFPILTFAPAGLLFFSR